jgi:hypothetical protein
LGMPNRMADSQLGLYESMGSGRWFEKRAVGWAVDGPGTRQARYHY